MRLKSDESSMQQRERERDENKEMYGGREKWI